MDPVPVATMDPGTTLLERPVHSIDKEPETGSRSSHIVAIIFISLLVLFGIILLVLGFRLQNATNVCTNTESDFCYTLTCPVSSPTIATCAQAKGAPPSGGSYAFRCTSKSTVQCNWNPGVDIPILAGEEYLCDQYVAPVSS